MCASIETGDDGLSNTYLVSFQILPLECRVHDAEESAVDDVTDETRGIDVGDHLRHAEPDWHDDDGEERPEDDTVEDSSTDSRREVQVRPVRRDEHDSEDESEDRAVGDVDDPTCECALERPGSTIEELAAALERDRSTVNRSLSTLCDRGLVRRDRRLLEEGGYVYQYTAVTLPEAKELLHDALDTWTLTVHEVIDEFDGEQRS